MDYTCPRCGARFDAPPGLSDPLPCPACREDQTAANGEAPAETPAPRPCLQAEDVIAIRTVDAIQPEVGGGADETSVLAPPTQDVPEALLGHCTFGFRIDALLGEGPFTFAYQGEQIVLRRTVILKVMKATYATDVARIHAFLDAGRTAARLTHPGIAQVYDVISAGDMHFIARQYAKGKHLAGHLDGGTPINESLALRIGLASALALKHAHASGLVHGNLSLTNVFAEDAHRVCLTDFCQQRTTADLMGRDAAGLPCLAFLAPEVLAGAAPDARSDIYSLGAVLYAACTRRAPLPPDQIESLRRGAPCPGIGAAAADINARVPKELSRLLADMLAVNPVHRPDSMAEVHGKMQEILHEYEGADDAVESPEARIRDKLQALPPPSKRRYRRLRTDMEVRIAPRAPSREAALSALGSIGNISENGAFVESEHPLPVGSMLDLNFALGDGVTRVQVLGIVRWTETQKKPTGMGIQFLEATTADRKHLRSYVDERVSSEMAEALTESQMHRSVLRLVLHNWGNAIGLDKLVRTTGTSKVLLVRTLAAFERYGLIEIRPNEIECIRPASQALVDSLQDALYRG